MNRTLTHLTLSHSSRSPLFSISSLSATQRLTLSSSTFSRFVSSAVSSFSKSSFQLNANSVLFDKFQSTAVSLHSQGEEGASAAKTISATFKATNKTVNFRKCIFSHCFTNNENGGAISSEVGESSLELKYCNFVECGAIKAEGGAIFATNFIGFNVTRCCFNKCSSDKSVHVIFTFTDKSPTNIEETVFCQCGDSKVSELNHFDGDSLLFSQTNTTYNKALDAVLFSINEPEKVLLKHCNWVNNEGATGILHLKAVKASRTESWEYNNVFFNVIKDAFINGTICATIDHFAMSGNSIQHFWDVDSKSTIHLTNGVFDFHAKVFRNKNKDADATINYRQDTIFDQAVITPISLEVSKKDYCYAFEAKKIFKTEANSIIRIQQISISNHPHITFIIAVLFVCIILFIYYAIQRKSETRQGLMRNVHM